MSRLESDSGCGAADARNEACRWMWKVNVLTKNYFCLELYFSQSQERADRKEGFPATLSNELVYRAM
jgi:hypothetical protein